MKVRVKICRFYTCAIDSMRDFTFETRSLSAGLVQLLDMPVNSGGIQRVCRNLFLEFYELSQPVASGNPDKLLILDCLETVVT